MNRGFLGGALQLQLYFGQHLSTWLYRLLSGMLRELPEVHTFRVLTKLATRFLQKAPEKVSHIFILVTLAPRFFQK